MDPEDEFPSAMFASNRMVGGRKRKKLPGIAASLKKRRRAITLKVKLDIIKRCESGEGYSQIGRDFSLPSSTVRTICKNAEKIKRFAKRAPPLSVTQVVRHNRSDAMYKMEHLLTVWIRNRHHRRLPLTMSLIQEKAKKLYEDLKSSCGEGSKEETFTASHGWFNRYKKRASLYNVNVATESLKPDDTGAQMFPAKLLEAIESGGYSSKQVFSVVQTGLYWKRLPQKTSISREECNMEGFKPSKDRFTLLLGGNASGDFKLKPLIVYHTETPKALKGYSKGCLPVIWRAHPEMSVSANIFEDWFCNYFISVVETYCLKNNLSNKALLLLEDMSGNMECLDDLYENVKVIHLPPNTTSLLHPMEQGALSSFKTYYLRRLFDQATEAIDCKEISSFKEFWEGYSIHRAITNVCESWNEVSPSNMNCIWSKIWPGCLSSFKGFEESVDDILRNIVVTGRQLGFDELELEDVEKLLSSHREQLSSEDLALLEVERSSQEESEIVEMDARKVLVMSVLSKMFSHFESGMALMEEHDPNTERSMAVRKAITKGYACYRELFNKKKRALMQPQRNVTGHEEPTNGTNSCLPHEEVDKVSNTCKRRKDDQRMSGNEDDRTTPLVFSEINIKTEEMSDSSFTVEEEGFHSNVDHGDMGVRRRVSKRPYSEEGSAAMHTAGASGLRAQMRAKMRGGASCDESSYTAEDEEEEGVNNPNAEYITAEEAEGGIGYLIEDEVTRNADNALVMRIISQTDEDVEGQEGSDHYKTEKQALVPHTSHDPMEYQDYGCEKDGPLPVECLQLEDETGTVVNVNPFKDFSRLLVSQNVRFSQMNSRNRRHSNKRNRHDVSVRLCSSSKHYPSMVPPTEKKKAATRVCVVCSGTIRRERKRRESRFMCSVCDVGLCVVPCFKDYHELQEF